MSNLITLLSIRNILLQITASHTRLYTNHGRIQINPPPAIQQTPSQEMERMTHYANHATHSPYSMPTAYLPTLNSFASHLIDSPAS